MSSGQMMLFAFIFIVVGTLVCLFTFVALYLMLEKAADRGVMVALYEGKEERGV